MKGLQHNHIIAFLGSYEKNKDVGIVMFPVASYDLKTYMEKVSAYNKDHLEEHAPKPHTRVAKLKSFFPCICQALLYLHGQDRPIKHKDIKPTNILIDRFDGVILADFGISKDYLSQSETVTDGPTQNTKIFTYHRKVMSRARSSSATVPGASPRPETHIDAIQENQKSSTSETGMFDSQQQSPTVPDVPRAPSAIDELLNMSNHENSQKTPRNIPPHFLAPQNSILPAPSQPSSEGGASRITTEEATPALISSNDSPSPEERPEDENIRVYIKGRVRYIDDLSSLKKKTFIVYDGETGLYGVGGFDELDLRYGYLVALPKGDGWVFHTPAGVLNLWRDLPLRVNLKRTLGIIRHLLVQGDYTTEMLVATHLQ
ncbi:hypothetical protein K402DRAFT_424686 [Aulographum hederae CBS 113979]|uniref:Protein kinase domain-containing protein n=1 Tax=Aulographum hederae CBS 113979 TaxID=1176131 RepID=A0A6G1GND7_9PEZI|nr:hypothetical protein K402DRAFT_424686 [Aulographum hederae CBS 113979]